MANIRMVKTRVTRIRDGIEWFDVLVNGVVEQADECQCARCGSSAVFQDCDNCGGDGELGSDCIDDLCHGGECIHGDSGQIRCSICRGVGGWWHCCSPRPWCEAHPMVGREHISTTAQLDEEL